MLYAVLNPEKIALSGLASFPFARHYSENLGWFLFLALLRCFSSGGSPHIPILFSIWYTSYTCMDCSIRKSTDQSVLTAPRSLSQLITSFIGSQCQGILHMLFFAWTTLKYFNTFCISFDIHRFSSLELLCFILAVNIFRYSDKIVSFTLNRKTWFRFHDIFVFPFTFVCHVCHTNSFELICYKFLFGFQWTFRLTLSN